MSSTYRYTEIIKTPDNKIEHVASSLEVDMVKEKDLEKKAEKLFLCSGLFRGKGPWMVCRSAGYPTMVLDHKEVLSTFVEPPTSLNYIKLCQSDNKGWLIYCRRHEYLASIERYTYNFVYSKEPEYKEYIRDGKIWEPKLMESISEIPESKRCEDKYVSWRVKLWEANLLLPQQYLTLGWGNSIQLSRIARIHGLNMTQAWDMMWLGRTDTKNKKIAMPF